MKAENRIESDYRVYLEHAPVAFLAANAEGYFIDCNGLALELLGYSRKELLGRHFKDVLAPKDLERAFRDFSRLQISGSVNEEYTLLAANGLKVEVSLRSVKIDKDRLIAYFYDITEEASLRRERSLAQASLSESEARYRTLFENMINAYVHCRVVFEEGKPVDWVYLNVNPAFEKQTGLKNVLGKKLTDIFPKIKAQDPYLLEICGRVARTGMPHMRENFVEQLGKWFAISYFSPAPGEICEVFENVTERKTTEIQLLREKTQLRALLDAIPDYIWMKDTDGRISLCNSVFARLGGYKDESEVIGHTDDDYAPAEIASRYREQDRMTLTTGKPLRVEEMVPSHPGGPLINLEVIKTPVVGHDGEVVGILGIGRDITDRIKTRADLQNSIRKFQLLFEGMLNGYALGKMEYENDQGVDFTYLDINPAFEKLSGLKQVIGKKISEVIPGIQSSNRELLRMYGRVAKGGSPEYMEVFIESLNSWFSIGTYNSGKDEFIAVFENITERKKAEEDLLKERSRLRTLVDTIPDMVWLKDVEGKFLFCNHMFERFVGMKETEVLGQRDEAFTTSEQASFFRENDRIAMQADRPVINEESIVMADTGETMFLETIKTPLKDQSGELIGILGIGRNISQRKRAIEALRESENALYRSEQTLRLFVEYAPAAIAMFDRNMVYLAASRRFLTDYNLGQQSVIGRSHYDIFPEISDRWKEIHKRCIAGAVEKCEEDPFPRLDGHTDWVRWEIHPWYDVSGAIGGILLFSENITERKNAALILTKVNRALKALGTGNEILIHATDEKQMLSDMCRNVVQTAGYHQAWVGLKNESGAIYPAAQSGYPDGYLEQTSLAAERELADGLPDRAVTTGHLQIIQDAVNDPSFTATRTAAERFGFGSFLSIPLISERETLGVICIYAKEPRAFDDEEVRLLTELANDMAYGIMNLRQGIKYRNTSEKLQLAMEKTIFAIATTVEMRDPYTAGHERRVGELACAIARELGLSEDRIHGIRLASIVHDMGKINIPAEILSKPTRLTALEYKLIQTHAQSGYDILKDVDFPWPIAQIVHQHHERMDGSGYPQGLKGEETILEARIVAVADTVEAMASHRPYRAALGPEIALEEIQKNRGKFYDPDVADACIRLFREKNFEFSS